MRLNWLWLALFVLFLLESTIMQWIIPVRWQTDIRVSPHFVLIAVLYIGLFRHRYSALAYGIAFGLLQDVIFYGHMLGVNSFSMGLTGYIMGVVFRKSRPGMLLAILMLIFGYMAYELMNYGLYWMFSIAGISLRFALLNQVLPSLLLNMLFALLVYVPARKVLTASDKARNEEDEEEVPGH